MKKNNYIESLIEKGESQTLDFKYNINDSRKIAKSLVAFANTNGGTLLIGVRDNGTIAGIRKEEELYMLEAAAEVYSKPKIEMIAKDWKILDKTILEIKIEVSQHKPHFAENENGQWLAYIRVNDNNIVANKVIQKVWKRQNQTVGTYLKYRKKEELLLQFLEQENAANINQIYNLLKLPRFVSENILVNLICLDIIKMNITEENVLYSLV